MRKSKDKNDNLKKIEIFNIELNCSNLQNCQEQMENILELLAENAGENLIELSIMPSKKIYYKYFKTRGDIFKKLLSLIEKNRNLKSFKFQSGFYDKLENPLKEIHSVHQNLKEMFIIFPFEPIHPEVAKFFQNFTNC